MFCTEFSHQVIKDIVQLFRIQFCQPVKILYKVSNSKFRNFLLPLAFKPFTCMWASQSFLTSMSVSSFPNGFTAALPTLSQAMNTKNYKALCARNNTCNLITKNWHLSGMHKLKETKVKVKVRRKSQPGCRASRGSTQWRGERFHCQTLEDCEPSL